MQYGICHLSLVPVRIYAEDTSEMISQLLYGEHFKILERRKLWSRIRAAFDATEGWVSNLQITEIEEDSYHFIETIEHQTYTADLVSFVETEKAVLLPVLMGSHVVSINELKGTHEGTFTNEKKEKTHLVETALLYLNTPYLWGGKTPFGIDASGFAQMVYKINGYKLARSASGQSMQGVSLSFIEESEAGDLAFFDNSDGEIYHVGILMENNYIIHVDGIVRIDRIDHTGIFNTELGRYTFQLRVIKQIV
ncbi:C40 family peptidase [Pareuzebyella sediminis]|uniref:C40 family peptidase n=1 Tax=Pareuzebyella sediminis TaxID=2607998 RepID=UPI0011EBE023|nr:C40 family peptidase [Pareuzebyella sediminis]